MIRRDREEAYEIAMPIRRRATRARDAQRIDGGDALRCLHADDPLPLQSIVTVKLRPGHLSQLLEGLQGGVSFRFSASRADCPGRPRCSGRALRARLDQASPSALARNSSPPASVGGLALAQARARLRSPAACGWRSHSSLSGMTVAALISQTPGSRSSTSTCRPANCLPSDYLPVGPRSPLTRPTSPEDALILCLRLHEGTLARYAPAGHLG